MQQIMKYKPSRMKAIVDGMKMIYMPLFYSHKKSSLVKFEIDLRSDKQKLRDDYRKSTEEISKGVKEFELLHRK
ncbi:hypothetical protein [Enterococcus asini]|uniref:hypothetical protein n=1 Tax=Enterococcus asini TaxID=57732 RepID=UPI00241C2675|nr:hypothetical protein [Enterococcus asini]